MSTRTNLSRITIDIPAVDHKRLKAVAAIMGKSMREVVIASIAEHLAKSNVPNAKTIKAMKKVDRGEDLVEAKDVDDLFKKLGI